MVHLLTKYNILNSKFTEVQQELEIEKENIENISTEKEEIERIVDEKNFKFLAINQMAKTLAKEKNLNILKRLIMDMMLEVNSIKRGFSLERYGDTLKIFELQNMSEIPNITIHVDDDKEMWEYFKTHKVSKIKQLQNFTKLSDIVKEFDDGYVMSFLITDEIGLEDIYYLIFMGEKTYGNYGDGEMEFFETLGGQIEIILENAIKNNFIEEQNKELTEKVYDLLTLNNAAKMVTSTLDIEEIYKSSIDMYTEVAQAMKGCIMTYDRDSEALYIKAARGEYKQDDINKSLKIKEEFLEVLKKDSNVKIISNLRESEMLTYIFEFLKENQALVKELKSELFIPLVANEEVLGIILLGMRYSDEGYREDNVEVYNTLANQIAISLYNAKLYNLAITDGMTKLFLHRYFQTRLEEELERTKRYKRKLSLIMLDIDHFKKFNDTYGHQTGDEVLKKVAKAIKEYIRKSDVAARYGGEEFSVILPETDEKGSIKVGENLRKAIESLELQYHSKILKVTISLGCYTYNPDEADSEEITKDNIIDRADQALYKSKERGRNKVTHYNNMKLGE